MFFFKQFVRVCFKPFFYPVHFVFLWKFFRPVDGYRTLDAGYRVHSRPQLDPYAAQPQVGRMGSAMEISGMQRFVPEPYGLEDDQRSLGYDEPDYGMGPPMHYSTMPRLGHHAPPPRRTGLVQASAFVYLPNKVKKSNADH